MGLFSKLLPRSKVEFSGSVTASERVIERTDKQVDMLRSGYRENWDHEIFAPDTVWFSSRSKVYHSSDCCAGSFLSGASPYPEAEGVRRGLTRCKKCEWHGAAIPKPCKRPAQPARPVSKATVRPARRGEFK